jgi:hypothetical protein
VISFVLYHLVFPICTFQYQYSTPQRQIDIFKRLPYPTTWSKYNNPMKLVPLYDGEENIGSAPLVTNLDTWDGMRWRHLSTGCHLGVGKLDDGRYYACYASDWSPVRIISYAGILGVFHEFIASLSNCFNAFFVFKRLE